MSTRKGKLQKPLEVVVFLNRALGTSPEHDRLLQVQGLMAQYERAQILERSRDGKRHKARLGSVNVLSGAPYGYRYVSAAQGGGEARSDRLPKEAEVVKPVFRWVGQERLSIGEVIRRLTGSVGATSFVRWSSESISITLKSMSSSGWKHLCLDQAGAVFCNVVGGVTTPLLSNLYLHLLDRIGERHELERRYRARLVRYAEDGVALCAGDVEAPMAALRQVLGKWD